MPPSSSGYRDHRERMVACEKRHQDPGVAVARDQRRVGLAVDGSHLDHPGKPRASTADGAGDDDELADAEPAQARSARVASDDAGAEAEGADVHQDVADDASDQAVDEAPMHVETGDVGQ